MIPTFDHAGNLPEGVYWASWKEFEEHFGFNPHRRKLLKGLQAAIASLRKAGCRAVFIDGSFVTAKERPNDFDACWGVEDVDPNLLDPVLLDFSNGRAAQKAKYGGELFPAEMIEAGSGKPFVKFFQIDRDTSQPKGIVGIRLRRAPPKKKK